MNTSRGGTVMRLGSKLNTYCYAKSEVKHGCTSNWFEFGLVVVELLRDRFRGSLVMRSDSKL